MSAAMAGCGGEFVRDSQSPARLVVTQRSESDGAEHRRYSDVITLVTNAGAVHGSITVPVGVQRHGRRAN